VPIGFRQYSASADAFTRAPLIVRDRNGQVTHLRFSNQLRQPIPFDEPELAEWYRAYRLLGRIVADPANHVAFRLRAGDMLFVNNHRVLHSRKAFAIDGPRHLQDVYFSADDIVGRLDQMTGTATSAMMATGASGATTAGGTH
jgi:gamma-butyrobetaine dioxygenase